MFAADACVCMKYGGGGGEEVGEWVERGTPVQEVIRLNPVKINFFKWKIYLHQNLLVNRHWEPAHNIYYI